MAPNSNRARTVFIGNISFDAEETELRTLFSSVGPVLNLRLVVDRDTGKRKGFGFAEYADQETALSAVRNLNDLDLHGRALRVNIAEQDTKTSNAESAQMTSRKRKAGAGGAPSWESGGGPPSAPGGMPPQVALPEVHLPSTLDPVAAYVERLGRAQMFELVLQAKHFAAAQPEEAARLLISHPPAYSALQLVIDRLAGPHWPPPVADADAAPLATDTAAWVDRVRGGADAAPASLPPPPAGSSSGASAPRQYPPALETAAAAMGVPASVLEAQLVALTPEQLKALPAEQQGQVAELQAMLK